MTPLTLLHREQEELERIILKPIPSEAHRRLSDQLREVDTLINLLIGPRRVNQ